jgi:hypothetical protein
MAINPNDTGASRAGFDATTGIGTTTDTGSTYRDNARRDGASSVAHLKQEARERAGEVVGRARERASSGIEDTMVRAASELGTVANALRQCGSDMNGNENAMLAPYIERVADQVDRISGFLESRSVNDLARDVQSFARRNPAVFLGACFAGGVLAARFLRSSRPQLPVPYDQGPYGESSVQRFDEGNRYGTAGRVGYGEATYTEPASTNEPVSNDGFGSTGGAAYSGPFRGTTGGL